MEVKEMSLSRKGKLTIGNENRPSCRNCLVMSLPCEMEPSKSKKEQLKLSIPKGKFQQYI